MTLAPIVGHLEETKAFARASKGVNQPGAGPVDENNNSSMSETAIQSLRASSKNNQHHNSTAQHDIQMTGPRQLTEYLENFNIIWLASSPVPLFSRAGRRAARFERQKRGTGDEAIIWHAGNLFAK